MNDAPRSPVSLPDAAGDAGVPCGAVVWITGLSGAGKTTLAMALVAQLRDRGRAAVLLDGDVLREVFEHDLGYALDDRRRCGRRYARLGGMLAAQGLHVVVATISMFEDLRRWNRAQLPRYVEVYVRAPAAVRHLRGTRARPGGEDGGRLIVGEDVPFEEPEMPDLVLDNDGSVALDQVAARLWEHVRGNLALDRE
ncbi:MAG: adenylyl-sulfate kinase [Deltaproteobacteria bacterium]|nr:adenylyl-sulfate kinase [Deltaproteobacteria bacterium]